VQFGGGLREISDVRELIESGAARVVVGTLVLEAEEKLTRLVELFGTRVAVGLDARGGRVVTRGWEKQEDVTAVELAAQEIRRRGRKFCSLSPNF
jgi:phosphoribosylformimino-5-aminoimidazole carboxamide ribotide isomerase